MDQQGLFATITSYLWQPHGPQPLPDYEVALQTWTTVITNCGALPTIILCMRRGLYYEAIIGFATFLTSFLYHAGETLQLKFLGMNPGAWHRLDNIFMIGSVQALVFCLFIVGENDVVKERSSGKMLSHSNIQVANFLKTCKLRTEFLRWSSFCFAVWCQEKAPWNELYTLYPILIPAVVVLYYYFFKDEFRSTFIRKWLMLGFIFLACAITSFIIALDDKKDWIRLAHGCWHLFASLSFFCFFMSKQVVSDKEKE